MNQRILAIGILTTTLCAISPTFASDAVKGEKLFKKCGACHKIGPDAKNGVGPNLTGVVGRVVGSVEDYKYGPSTKTLGETGLVWNEEELNAYLEDPKKYLRAKLEDDKAKSKMTFKMKKEEERADIIAYLATFSEPKVE